MPDGLKGEVSNPTDGGVSLPPDLQKKLQKLPPEVRVAAEQELKDFVQQSVMVAYQGPLPPPFMIEGYERHHPGFLNELLERSRDAQRHVHEMDELEIRGQFSYLDRGQKFGFVVALAAIVGAVVCAALGQWQIGVALGLTGLAPVIGHFLQNPFSAVAHRAEEPTTPPKKADPPKKRPPSKTGG